MKTILQTIAVIILLQAFCAASFSQTRRFCVTGVITYVDDNDNVLNGDVQVGDIVNGIIVYNLNAADDNALPTVGDYHYTTAPYGIYLNINNRVFQTDTNNVDFLLETVNDHNGDDNIVFRSYTNTFIPAIPELGSENHISWQLDDTSETALSTTDLPTSINLSDWEQDFGLVIDAGDMDTTIFIRATVAHVDTCENLSGIENKVSRKNQLAFPNPFSHSTTIKFSSAVSNNELIIYNLYGEKVRTIHQVSGDRVTIYREDLPVGTYFIKLVQQDKTMLTTKLIIID